VKQTFKAVLLGQLELRNVVVKLLGDFQTVFLDSLDPDYKGHYLLEMSLEGQIELAFRDVIFLQ